MPAHITGCRAGEVAVLIAHVAASVVEVASVVIEAVEVTTAPVVEASGLLVIAVLIARRYVFGKCLEGIVVWRIEDCRGFLSVRLVFEELVDLMF